MGEPLEISNGASIKAIEIIYSGNVASGEITAYSKITLDGGEYYLVKETPKEIVQIIFDEKK